MTTAAKSKRTVIVRKKEAKKTIAKAKEAIKSEETEEEKVEDVLTTEREEAKIKPPVKAEPPVLAAGQKYFEAPDGTLIIGEADKQQIWCRTLNNGKGGWINPKR